MMCLIVVQCLFLIGTKQLLYRRGRVTHRRVGEAGFAYVESVVVCDKPEEAD